MLGFLFVADEALEMDEKSVSKLKDNAADVLDAAIETVEGLTAFTTASLEEALRARIVDEMEVKPRLAFGPLRVAVTGRQVSPPLFESMEILGRESSLTRLRALRASLA
jgi:glutamate--tRNA ligase